MRKQNPEKHRARLNRYYVNHIKELRVKAQARESEAREKLTVVYVKRLLTRQGFPSELITEGLLEVKRLQIQLKRETRRKI